MEISELDHTKRQLAAAQSMISTIISAVRLGIIVVEEDHATRAWLFDELYAGKQPVGEMRYRRIDGSSVWCMVVPSLTHGPTRWWPSSWAARRPWRCCRASAWPTVRGTFSGVPRRCRTECGPPRPRAAGAGGAPNSCLRICDGFVTPSDECVTKG